MGQNIAIVLAEQQLQILGKELLKYTWDAACQSHCDKIIISSSNKRILEVANGNGGLTHKQDPQLAISPYQQSLQHTINTIKGHAGINNIIFLCGDSVFISAAIINDCLDKLSGKSHCSAVITVSEAKQNHPHYALCRRRTGSQYLKASLGKNDLPLDKPHFYHDDGVMAFRAVNWEMIDGPQPWPFLGKKICYFRQPWPMSVKISTRWDKELAEAWLKAGKFYG